MTVSLPGVFDLKQPKTGNASVIPFIGDQTVRVLRKLLLTVNRKLTHRETMCLCKAISGTLLKNSCGSKHRAENKCRLSLRENCEYATFSERKATLIGQRRFWRKPSIFATRMRQRGIVPDSFPRLRFGLLFWKKWRCPTKKPHDAKQRINILRKCI